MNDKIKVVNHKKMLCTDGKKDVYYKKGKLYVEMENRTDKICIPLTLKGKVIVSFRILERIFRMEPKTAIMEDNALYFSCHGFLYKYLWETASLSVVHRFRKNMNNPVCLKKVQGVNGFTDGIIYGEYWGNPEKEEVKIFQERKGKWEIVYAFPRETITHIHGFVPDHYHNRILILTGDSDQGSGIWSATEDFRTVKPLIVGTQKYRSCVAFAKEDGIIYATDTPLEKNAIYFLEEKDGRMDLKKMKDLPGPCIYGKKLLHIDGECEYVFATSVEPDSRIKGLSYLLTYKLGQGVRDRHVHIFKGNEKQGFSEILSLKKDILPMGLFQFGNVQFPESNDTDIICTPQSIKKYDCKTIQILETE